MLFPQRRNPVCLRAGCSHPLKGNGRDGHFAMGSGPCKVPNCACSQFLAASRLPFGPFPVDGGQEALAAPSFQGVAAAQPAFKESTAAAGRPGPSFDIEQGVMARPG